MKKLKLIFGLLIVAAFVATTVLSATSSNDQAIRKDAVKTLHRDKLNSNRGSRNGCLTQCE